jgi:citrate lyase beta subunit
MIISNNIINELNVPSDTIARLNLAWVKSIDEARQILDDSKFKIYLDFPYSRTKPPKPVLTLDDAIELSKHDKVLYLAVSNAEDIKVLKDIMSKIGEVELIPKIETEKGVNNLGEIIKLGIKKVMLDKEDLYVDVGTDSDKFNDLVNRVREYNIKILELKGVIFV